MRMWSRVCRMCLVTDVTMHSMEPHVAPALHAAYTELTGVSFVRGVQYACYECARLLTRAHRLKLKSLRAHALLHAALLNTGEVLQSELLLAIDRVKHNLVSSLKRGPILKVDFSDAESSVGNEVKIEMEGAFLEDDSKVWRHDIEIVKEEPQELNGELGSPRGPGSPMNSLHLISLLHTEKNKHKKKKHKVKKKMDNAKIVETKVTTTAARRKTKKELEEFYSRFVSVSHMTPCEAQREMQLRRESNNYKAAAHKCTLCFRGFWRVAAYDNHMAKHDPKSGAFECDYCRFRFSSRHSILDHFRHFHNLKFSCNKCAYTCTNRNLARQHEAWHTGTLYSCKYCTANFSHYSTRQNHMRLKHSLEVACKLCGRCFVGRRGVRAHTLRAHARDETKETGDGEWCEACAVQFVSREAYDRHLRVSAKHNLSETTAACTTCGETFPNSPELQQHRRVQHSRRPQQEGDIRKRSKRKEREGEGGCKEKRQRARTDTVCETCGKVFHSNWDFDTHRRKHTGERPFACKYCAKTFALKGILKVHIRTHTQEKPHVCAACGKAFAERSNMLRHTQIHSEGAPVICDVCDKQFKNLSSLKVHIKYVHLKRPYPVRRQRKKPEGAPPVAALLPPVSDVRSQLLWRM